MKIAKLFDTAKIPTRNHPTDAGLDLYALDTTEIQPFSMAILRTGITIEVPRGCMILIKPTGRSEYLVGAGVVDEGYQGEILVKIANVTGRSMFIVEEDAIAQAIVVPIVTPDVEIVDKSEIHKYPTARAISGGIVTEHISKYVRNR